MKSLDPPLRTERTEVSLVVTSDARYLFKYFERNRRHLAPWEARRPDTDYTEDAWMRRADAQSVSIRTGSSYHFVVRCFGEKEIAAVYNFNNVVRGAFLACHLGFSVDHKLQGKGVMHEALDALIPFVFEKYDLHRIMANYMPRNDRSGRLLERLGFEKEGFAKDYLRIDGKWEDHILTSRINADTNLDT